MKADIARLRELLAKLNDLTMAMKMFDREDGDIEQKAKIKAALADEAIIALPSLLSAAPPLDK